MSARKPKSRRKPGRASGLTVGRIIRRYPKTMAVTWGLLLLESVLGLGFPLAIGIAIDRMTAASYSGFWILGGLCGAVLAVGAGRRFLDTRAYGRLYQDLAGTLTRKGRAEKTALSRLSARIGLLDELVAYFEQELPDFLDGLIGFAGVILLLWALDGKLAMMALAASLTIIFIYLVAGEPIWRLNRGHNNELERQLRALSSRAEDSPHHHFRRLTRWRIRMSDLETLNFSLVWIILAALLLAGIWLVGGNDALTTGQRVTAVMYLIQYIETVMIFPLLYQQFVRIREITGRLGGLDFVSKPERITGPDLPPPAGSSHTGFPPARG